MLDGFDGLGIQSEAQPPYDTYVAWVSPVIDNEPQNARALSLGRARLLGVLRIGGRNCLGSGDSAADLKYSAANAATASSANPRPVTNTNATAKSRPNAAAGAGSG